MGLGSAAVKNAVPVTVWRSPVFVSDEPCVFWPDNGEGFHQDRVGASVLHADTYLEPSVVQFSDVERNGGLLCLSLPPHDSVGCERAPGRNKQRRDGDPVTRLEFRHSLAPARGNTSTVISSLHQLGLNGRIDQFRQEVGKAYRLAPTHDPDGIFESDHHGLPATFEAAKDAGVNLCCMVRLSATGGLNHALNNREIAIVKGMLNRGDRQHDIAAYFGINSGRIAEINTGERGQGIVAALAADLPPAGPYISGRSALHARDTLKAVRDLIDEAIEEIDIWERADE